MNIERMQPADFDAVYRLLTQSFPATERRGAAGQRALFSDSAYRVDILRAHGRRAARAGDARVHARVRAGALGGAINA